MIKVFIVILIAIGVFGGGAYWTYELFLRPHQELKEEAMLPPEPPPPDPSLPDFEKCVALQKEHKLTEAQTAFAQFVASNPDSSKLEEARDRLGVINTSIFLSPIPAPDKQEYIVKSGDVLTKVANRLKTTPELIMRANNLSASMLRIGQKLVVSNGDFSVIVNKPAKKVVLLNHGRYFKQYPIRSLPVHKAVAGKKPAKPTPHGSVQKLPGKVTERIAWSAKGERVTFADKHYAPTAFWIAFSVPGNTLYSEPDADSGETAHKPPTGIGLTPDAMEELAALLRKGDPATIEQ